MGDNAAVIVHSSRIREKIKDDGRNPEILKILKPLVFLIRIIYRKIPVRERQKEALWEIIRSISTA